MRNAQSICRFGIAAVMLSACGANDIPESGDSPLLFLEVFNLRATPCLASPVAWTPVTNVLYYDLNDVRISSLTGISLWLAGRISWVVVSSIVAVL